MSKEKEKVNLFKPINDLLSGSFMGKDYVQKNLSFIAFLTLLTSIYIGYGYYVDSVMKKAASLENMEELNSELHSTIMELNQISLQSKIAKLTEQQNIKELKQAPVIIKKDNEE